MSLRIFDAKSTIAPWDASASKTKSFCAGVLAVFCLCLSNSAHLSAQASSPKPAPAAAAQTSLARHYQQGEKIAYTISCFNQARGKTTEYEARAEGVVRKDPSGIFFEDLAWPYLSVNDDQVRLSQGSLAFREPLSLAPGFKLAIPDLSRVQPALIAPIADLLTFYADVKIAMNQKGLLHAGDHAYVNFGAANSWADGTRIVLGQDSIDFEVLLKSIDQAKQIATLAVRHVPPEHPQIKLPARWMTTPVDASQNNWVQVEKGSDGKYTAGAGQETFDVQITVDLATGRLLSASMDNPVDVMERVCDDAALTTCGNPERYSIHRQITLRADPTPAQGVSH